MNFLRFMVYRLHWISYNSLEYQYSETWHAFMLRELHIGSSERKFWGIKKQAFYLSKMKCEKMCFLSRQCVKETKKFIRRTKLFTKQDKENDWKITKLESNNSTYKMVKNLLDGDRKFGMKESWESKESSFRSL
mgnify:CR=1 FL=1